MDIVRISELKTHDGQVVRVRGWIAGQRGSGKIVFLLVRDGTGTAQCIVEAAQAEAFAAAAELGQESSVILEGEVRLDARAPGGAELSVRRLTPVQTVNDYPIARKEHGTDFLLSHRHLWLRSPRQCAILRIRDTLFRAATDFFHERDFLRIDTPILSTGGAEGAGTLFKVDYFGEPAHLAQTGQLYLEAAAMALGRVYCFGPTFRAEKSKTRRHLTEFWMLEPEVAWAELPELMDLAEAMICRLVQSVLEQHREELLLLRRDTAALERIRAPFPRITYSEAVDLLRAPASHAQWEAELEAARARLTAGAAEAAALEAEAAQARKAWRKEAAEQRLAVLREELRECEQFVQNRPVHVENARTFAWGGDLGGDEETLLTRLFEQPVFISRYPRGVKAFYMKPDPDDPRVVLNMDLLAPEGYGEIIGGSQREEDPAALEARMRAEALDPAVYAWYLDLRRYGSVPHGGFGLGLERTIAWICGLRHIRETIPFPRTLGRMYP
jgi:asparaginyl-tRNA synthetase